VLQLADLTRKGKDCTIRDDEAGPGGTDPASTGYSPRWSRKIETFCEQFRGHESNSPPHCYTARNSLWL